MRPCRPSVVSVLAVCGLASGAAWGQDTRPLDEAVLRVFPSGQALPRGTWGGTDATNGPDVTVGELLNDDNNPPTIHLAITPLSTANPAVFAYGLGTESCNVGNTNVEWQGQCVTSFGGTGSNRKPVIPQNMYKMQTVNGSVRFEQSGQSWTKHAFTALTMNACALGCNGQGGQVLGVGCSDPYTAGRNGSQGNPSSSGGTGPRYIVNPFTGDYPWPIPANPATVDGSSRRIRVARSDLVLTTGNSPVQFFGEAVYVTRDDARYGNSKNNASWRRMFCTST